MEGEVEGGGEESEGARMGSRPAMQEGKEEDEEAEEKSSMDQQKSEKIMSRGREAEGEKKRSYTAVAALKNDVELNAAETNVQRDASRLLQLTCKFDSPTSLSSILEGMPVDTVDSSGYTAMHYAAEEHSARCIEFLLKRRAKTEIKSAEGFVALEIALQSERRPFEGHKRVAHDTEKGLISRMQMISWSPADKITELLTLSGSKDLTAIKILASHTRDVAQSAARLIIRGQIVAFAALLTVVGVSLVSTHVLSTEEHGDGTLFDVLVKKAISIGEILQDDDMKGEGCSKSVARYNLRQILLKELELLFCWCLDHDQTSDRRHGIPPTSSVPSLLMRAAQAGDIAVAALLIDHAAGVNETDSAGNTALHFSLRATVNTRDTRLVLKLVRHGASIILGNRLGLTPVHIAAGQGHLQALQIFLALEPSSVHISAETKETPLFLAVKGNHYECVRLLLQYGANRQVLNLRKQRPIDVADTSDMRALLSIQELSGNYGRVKDLNISSLSMATANTDYEQFDSEVLRLKSENSSHQLEFSEESFMEHGSPLIFMTAPSHFIHPLVFNPAKALCSYWSWSTLAGSEKLLVPSKTEMCRYFSMPGGCVRGEKCFYAHREEDLQGPPKIAQEEIIQSLVPFNTTIIPPERMVKRAGEDLSKKIFVGGLSPSVESDDLRDFFEGKFGAVMDAVVIGSHAGDHVQSRCFGFVTFKHEESVKAAVQAHYVNIFGKKVEIKDAVPRSILPTMEGIKGETDLSRSSSAEASKFSELGVMQVLDLPSLELLCQGKRELQVQLMNYAGYHGDSGASPFKLVCKEDLAAQVLPSTSSTLTISQGLAWAPTFRKWLPRFLAEVSNRLKEGEWYPLSSLKGDFRATCGLELDHAAIGYHKLSDFVRSIPEFCRMKIVPVGRGPATHMVLLPVLPRMTPIVTVQAVPPTPSGLMTCNSSLVDAGRSYAAAASQVTAKSTMESSPQSRRPIQQSNPIGSSPGQFELQKSFDNPAIPLDSRFRDLRLTDKFTSLNQVNPNDLCGGQHQRPAIVQDQLRTSGSSMQETDVSNLRDLLAVVDYCEGQPTDECIPSKGSTEFLTTSSVGPNMPPQARSGKSVSGEAIIDSQHEEPKTPVNQVNLRTFSTFNHPFTGFLPQDCFNTYNMWGQQMGQQLYPQTSQTILERQNQQSMPSKMLDQMLPWEDSPQSILHPYGRNYQQVGTQEAPRSLFSPGGMSPVLDDRGRPWGGNVCVCCCERKSLWVAIPCNHHSLCAVCKNALYKVNRSMVNCPVCTVRVERWIALH